MGRQQPCPRGRIAGGGVLFQDLAASWFDHEEWEAQIDALRERVSSWTGNVCQVYCLTESEYRQHVRSAQPIVREWIRDAVVVYGTPLAKVDPSGVA